MIVHGSMGTKISFFMTRFYCNRNICGESFECYRGWVPSLSLSLSLHASFCHHLNVRPGWWIQTSWGTLSVLMLMWWEIAARCKYSWRQWTFDNVGAAIPFYHSCWCQERGTTGGGPTVVHHRPRHGSRYCRGSPRRAPISPDYQRIRFQGIYMYVSTLFYGSRHHLHRWQEGVPGIQRRGIFQPNIYSSELVKGYRVEEQKESIRLCTQTAPQWSMYHLTSGGGGLSP